MSERAKDRQAESTSEDEPVNANQQPGERKTMNTNCHPRMEDRT